MARSSRVVFDDSNLKAMERALVAGPEDGINSVGNLVAGRARQNIIRYDAILTGDMYRSTGANYNEDGTAVTVSADVDYAEFVHDGTDRMRARPFLQDAIDDSQEEIADIIADAIRRATRLR